MKIVLNYISPVVIIIAITLLVVNIFLSIVGSSKGSVLAKIDSERHEVEKNNREFTSFLIDRSSLAKFSETALKLGMEKPQNILYFSSESSVATIR